MRATVALDDDVASALRPLLAGGKPKQVMNDLLRSALGIRVGNSVELPVFNLRLKPGIDPVSLNKLSEDLAFDAEASRLGL